MAAKNQASRVGLVLALASAPAVGMFVAIILRYGADERWSRLAYAAWGVAALGVTMVVVLALVLASWVVASAAARAFRPRR